MKKAGGIKMKRALYVGRFQFFHNGHFDVVKFIDGAPDIEEIVIAIGSSQFDHTKKSPKWPWANNPFSYKERKEMLEKSLDGQIEKPVLIHPVPDYFDYPKWFGHIQEHLPKTQVLYTSERAEKEFFSARGYEVRDFPREHDYHAAILRERVYKGEEYREAIVDGCLEVFDRIGGEERIKELFARDIADKFRVR